MKKPLRLIIHPLFLLLLIWLFSWVILFIQVKPGDQNFPINDDWSFSRSAFSLARGDGIQYDGWPGMPFITQMLWSAPYVWALGETHFATRLSTIFLALFGLVAFYDLLKSEFANARFAAFLTATLAFNPWFYELAGSYLTDLPSLSLSMIGLACARRGLTTESSRMRGLSLIFFTLGVLNRQNAIAAPLAAGLAVARKAIPRKRLSYLIALFAVVCIGFLTAYWFNHRPDSNPVRLKLPDKGTAGVGCRSLFLLGLSILPVVFLKPPTRGSECSYFLMLVAGLALLYTRVLGDITDHSSLFLGNIVTAQGAFTEQPGELQMAAYRYRNAVIPILGFMGVATLIIKAIELLKSPWSTIGFSTRLILIYSMIQVLPLVITGAVFDRYILIMVPCALMIVGYQREPVRFQWGPGLVTLAVFGLFSFALLHDSLDLNRARWTLARRAVSTGIAPRQINGGFEWNGWSNSMIVKGRIGVLPDKIGKVPSIPLEGSSFWNGYFSYDWDGEEPVAFQRGYKIYSQQLPQTRVVDSEPYRLWLCPRRGLRYLYLLAHEENVSSTR